MAYLHCHTKNCHWSQDDFWDFSFDKYGYWKFPFIGRGWGYNPFSLFMSYIFTSRGYWYPRRIMHDKNCMEDHGWTRPDPHSWFLAWRQFKDIFWRFKRQVWWKEKDFKRDHKLGIAKCPNCGKDDFDID